MKPAICRARWWLSVIVPAVMLGTPTANAAGPDYKRDEDPTVDAIEDARGLLGDGFGEPKRLRSLFPPIKRQTRDLSPFWRDAQVQLKPRSYYFDRERDDSADSVAGALGGTLSADSGWWRERLRVSAALYTSQRLYGPRDQGGTLLLKPVQNSFTVLGQAYVELRLTDNQAGGLAARIGRTDIDLPYINRQDSRMVPNTFEGVGLSGRLSPQWETTLTYVTRMKQRNSDQFIPVSEAAGLLDTDEHLAVGGLRWSPVEGFNIGAMSLYAREFMNTFYTEANYSTILGATMLGSDIGVSLSAQYSDQRSVGRELGGDIKASVFGSRAEASWRGATASLAFTSTADHDFIRNPFGGYPGYISLMQSDFNRPGENAWLVGLAYDFSRIKLKGLSVFSNYARGSTGANDQTELDLTLDWRPPGKWWNGLWLRLRHARLDRNGGDLDDVRDWRVVLNYTLPIL